MANAIWLPGFPQHVQSPGHTESPENNIITNPVDEGPKMARQNDVDAGELIPVTMLFTLAQKIAFKAWWRDALGYGSLPFDWVHPTEGYSCEILVQGWKFAHKSGQWWTLTMTLEVLP
jgi:hypothetical protein